jgi:hypothetical protein
VRHRHEYFELVTEHSFAIYYHWDVRADNGRQDAGIDRATSQNKLASDDHHQGYWVSYAPILVRYWSKSPENVVPIHGILIPKVELVSWNTEHYWT